MIFSHILVNNPNTYRLYLSFDLFLVDHSVASNANLTRQVDRESNDFIFDEEILFKSTIIRRWHKNGL